MEQNRRTLEAAAAEMAARLQAGIRERAAARPPLATARHRDGDAVAHLEPVQPVQGGTTLTGGLA